MRRCHGLQFWVLVILAKRHLCMIDQSLEMDEKSFSMELRPNTIMCAFFSIQIRRGLKKFRLQAPWSQNWCLVWITYYNHGQPTIATSSSMLGHTTATASVIRYLFVRWPFRGSHWRGAWWRRGVAAAQNCFR